MLKLTRQIILLLGIILIAVGYWQSHRSVSEQSADALKQKSEEIQKSLDKIRAEVQSFNEGYIQEIKGGYLLKAVSTKPLQNQQIDLIQFIRDRSLFWTTSQYQVSPDSLNGFQILHHGSMQLACWTVKKGPYSLIYLYNIFPDQNPKLNPDTALDSKNIRFFIGNEKLNPSKSISIKLLDSTKTANFYISIETFKAPITYDLWILLGLLIVTLCLYWFQINSSKKIWWFLAWFLWLITVVMLQKGWGFQSLAESRIFSPKLFYYNTFFNSLGIIFCWSVLLIWLVFILRDIRFKWLDISKPRVLILSSILPIILAEAILFFVLDLAQKMVHNSDIHFDFFEVLLITRYSITAICVLILLIGSVFIILNALHQKLEPLGPVNRFLTKLLTSLPMLLLAYPLMDTMGFFMGLFFLILWFSLRHFSETRFDLWRIYLQVLLPCILLSFLININLKDKELVQRKKLASTLLLKKSNSTKNSLYQLERSLINDPTPLSYFKSNGNLKENFESYIKQLYLDNDLDNYDLSLFDFNTQGQPLSENMTIDYATLNAIYFSDLCIQATQQFFLINERRLRGCYLGKFNVSQGSEFVGSYFVLLTPKFGNSQGRLSDVLSQNTAENLFRAKNYSYAIYNRGKLNRHLGKFDYPTINVFADSTGVVNKFGYSHLIQKDEYNNTVIISKQDQSLLISSIQFTLLSLVGFLVVLVYVFIIWAEERLKWILKKFDIQTKISIPLSANTRQFTTDSWFLSRRLQLYITWLVFGIFIVVLMVTINYFFRNNVERQRIELLNKVNNIATKISGEINLTALQNKYQVGLVYDLAEYYQTDINVYDQFGKLIVSTNPKLFNEKYLSEWMNPIVYQKYTKNEISSEIVSEQIADLNYISAYTTLIDNDLMVRGYVNLPYFSNREDLFREISNFVVTIINIFALIFALALIFTALVAQRLSKPLLLIRNQISQMKIGEKNMPIQWQRNDEIGLLVAEYNKMLTALDLSLNKLAESERQGAWREMAKQVAHEIKNPLTPMRLSLQHLQFSMGRGDDNIEEKVKKTIALLIRQIDSLSTMAEEFSSFAKMPEPKLEKTDLKLILTDAAHLMEKEMGQPIQLAVDSGEMWIMADPHQLGRIFNNIFKNAIQAIPEDRTGKINVRAEIIRKKVVIRIEDNGKGIGPELFDKIFSPNFSTKNSGMGLGLAITKKIIEQFNGTIQFTSEVNVGTVFVIELPLI